LDGICAGIRKRHLNLWGVFARFDIFMRRFYVFFHVVYGMAQQRVLPHLYSVLTTVFVRVNHNRVLGDYNSTKCEDMDDEERFYRGMEEGVAFRLHYVQQPPALELVLDGMCLSVYMLFVCHGREG